MTKDSPKKEKERINMKQAIKSFVVGAVAAMVMTVVLTHIMTICLRPYEQDTGPIPNAVTTGQWDHPPVEGSVI